MFDREKSMSGGSLVSLDNEEFGDGVGGSGGGGSNLDPRIRRSSSRSLRYAAAGGVFTSEERTPLQGGNSTSANSSSG